MKIYFCMLLLLLTGKIVIAQDFEIAIVDGNNNPLNLIGSKYTLTLSTITGSKKKIPFRSGGNYTIKASKGDTLTAANNNMLIALVLNKSVDTLFLGGKIIEKTKIVNNSTGSSKGYWVGSKIGYNLDGKSSDDIIGGAKIEINPSNLFEDTDHSLAVIGNIGTFSSNTNTADKTAALTKLAQSQSGLGIGLGYIYKLWGDNNEDQTTGKSTIARIEISGGYRLNSFRDPKVDTLSIALNQFRGAALFEFELKKWKNGGRLTVDIEGSYSAFNSDIYKSIFNEERGHRFALETTIVVPISGNFGFMANMTNTKGIKPVYQFGIAFKTNKE